MRGVVQWWTESPGGETSGPRIRSLRQAAQSSVIGGAALGRRSSERQVQHSRQASGVWRATFWKDHVGRVAETPCLPEQRRGDWPPSGLASQPRLPPPSSNGLRRLPAVGSAAAGVWPVGGALKSNGATSREFFFPSGSEPERLAAAGPALLTLGCRWETNLLTERLSRLHLPLLLDAPFPPRVCPLLPPLSRGEMLVAEAQRECRRISSSRRCQRRCSCREERSMGRWKTKERLIAEWHIGPKTNDEKG